MKTALWLSLTKLTVKKKKKKVVLLNTEQYDIHIGNQSAVLQLRGLKSRSDSISFLMKTFMLIQSLFKGLLRPDKDEMLNKGMFKLKT